MPIIAPPSGYRHLKCLQESSIGALYFAIGEDDEELVTLKVYAPSGRSLHDEARARHELATLTQLAGSGVPRVLEARIVDCTPPHLVLERLPALSFDAWCASVGPAGVIPFLEIALQLTAVIDRAHRSHLVFGDVCGDNIRVDGATLQTYLVGCESAEPFEADANATDPWRRFAEDLGRLLYVAPERSGRMNRRYDLRSDLYSLGCVFYRILTEQPPFQSDDALGLIHAHIARVPTPVGELRPDLPTPVAGLVDKLLHKDPEGRYQSAAALYTDLEACLWELRRHGRIAQVFELGGAGVCNSPRFSNRLYGREEELMQLRGAFAAAALGQTRLLLLAGETGSGKTRLIEAIVPWVRECKGIVARGRFDQSRTQAYAGWAAAISSIVEQILLESDEELARWRADLSDALGKVAGALIELVPDLAIVVGEVPPIPQLGPGATRARLSLAVQRFVGACARPERPLMLALDDLHWSDPSSFELLEDLLREQSSCALLVVGAYRNRSVQSTESDTPAGLHERVSRWRESLNGVELIELGPLASDAVHQMVADALNRPADEIAGLNEVLERKTGSSPLLIRQFIEHISERGLLRYAPSVGWTWNDLELAAADVPDEAVALMTARLERLDTEGRRLVGIASCLGESFDLERLAPLLTSSGKQQQAALGELVAAGLIAPCARGYRFVHARIREAAYAQLGSDERAEAHARIGRSFIVGLSDTSSPEDWFAAVDQLNLGLQAAECAPRQRLLELNLGAAQRALSAGSTATAARYLEVARSLVEESDWDQHHALVVQIMVSSVECERDEGRSTRALELATSLLDRSTDPQERLELELLWLRLLPLMEPPEVSSQAALRLLRRLGVRWPLRPSYTRARCALLLTGWLVKLRGVDAMWRPEARGASKAKAIMHALAVSGPAIVLHDIRLAALASSLAVRLQLRYGRITHPAYRFATFAAFAYGLNGNPDLARKRAALALSWNDEMRDPVLGFRTEHVVNALIKPWVEPRRAVLSPMARVAEAIREVGDPEYFQYTRFLLGLYRALVGDLIEDVEPQLRQIMDRSLPNRPWYVEGRGCHTAYQLLESLPEVTGLRDKVTESYLEIRGDATYMSTTWMLVLCFFGDHEAAFEESERFSTRLHLALPFVHVADHTFYRGIAAGRLASEDSRNTRRKYRTTLVECLRRFRSWARGGPDFVHMQTFLAAELARIDGRTVRALALYEQAARTAETQNFPHHAALAHEYRAQLLESARRGMSARHARSEAARLYQRWGAYAKANQLLRMP